MSHFRWLEPLPVDDGAHDLTDYPLLSEILARRHVTDPAEVSAFLSPQLHHLHDPFLLPDMQLAVERIQRAIASQLTIAVFGDYDVDGLTSTSTLVRVLRKLGASVRTYVPHRIRDGYGLSERFVQRIIADGASLLITVDCGTTNGAELAVAHKAGIQTIVVDHHHVGSTQLPDTAFISPRRADSRYPFADLAAVGVVYHLVRALIGDDAAAGMLPLVALGTVADVVPLVGDNRVLVTHGLGRFAAEAPIGLLALAREAGIEPQRVQSWHFGFALGPRINASGRMDDPQLGLDLLLTDDPAIAQQRAVDLGKLNALRQRATVKMIEEAEHKLRLDEGEPAPLLLVSDPSWNVGLVGLAAGRLVERYARPAIVLSSNDEVSRGSARSIDGFDISLALHACDDLLLEHGGHTKAAGLTIRNGFIPELEDRLSRLVLETFGGDMPQAALRIDAELHPCELVGETVAILGRLEPFGHENPAPNCLVRGVEIRAPHTTRDGKHLRFGVVTEDGSACEAIFFNGANKLAELTSQRFVDLAFTLKQDVWKGRSRLSLQILDFRPATVPALHP